MNITKANFEILKNTILSGPEVFPAALAAINETEKAAADHNKKMVAYITEKRKNNKNYCR